MNLAYVKKSTLKIYMNDHASRSLFTYKIIKNHTRIPQEVYSVMVKTGFTYSYDNK